MKNMSKPKKQKPIVSIILIASKEAMIGALNRYAEISIAVAEANAKHELAVAALNAAHDEAMQPYREEMGSLETSLQLYAENHRDTLFEEGKKSLELGNAVIGFRLTPFSVQKRITKDTFGAIALRLEGLPWGDPYYSYKEPEVNKDALLRDQAQLTEEQLKEAGIKFSQTENFFIDLKAESAEGVRKEVAA